MKPIFIDFEASAINGFPIQVAYGTSEKDLKCFLIKPLSVWNNAIYMWDFNAQEIHGFSKSFINNHGVDAREIARIVSDDLREKTIYSDSELDNNWLSILLSDVAKTTGEQYAKPSFMLLQSLYFQEKISDMACARKKAKDRFRERGLRTHRADNDVLMHIWEWEYLNENRTY